MTKYETPKMDIMYFGDTVNTENILAASDPAATTAAMNMNAAAMTDPKKAAAARTTKVQTILQFTTN